MVEGRRWCLMKGRSRGGCGYVFVALNRPRNIDVDFEVLIDGLAGLSGKVCGLRDYC